MILAEQIPVGYQTFPNIDGVLVRSECAEALVEVKAIIFDLDGIIIDPSGSIFAAHPLAMQFWAENYLGITDCGGLVSNDDLAAFRLAGGFNDDWNIAAAVALTCAVKTAAGKLKSGSALIGATPSLSEVAGASAGYGGGIVGVRKALEGWFATEDIQRGIRRWDDNRVKQIFMEVVAGPYCDEMYGFERGHYFGDPLILNDRLLVNPDLIDSRFTSSIFTGRTRGEATVGLRLVGLDGWVPDELMVTATDGMKKPNGEAVRLLSDRLGGCPAAYIGDNIDDMNSVLLYRESGGQTPVYTVQVCYGDADGQARARFAAAGADIIAPTSDAALAAISGLAGREAT